MPNGKTITLDIIFAPDTIDMERIAVDEQRLISGGKQLEDHKTAASKSVCEW